MTKAPFWAYCFRTLFFLTAAMITAVAIIANSQNAEAVGFGVSPSSLEFVVEKGSEASRQLIIHNSGEEEAEFSATSSEPSLIKVSPNYGTVHESGTTVIRVTAVGKAIGVTEEEVSINFARNFASLNSRKDKEVSLSLGTTVKAKVNVVKPASASANASAFVGMLLSAGIVLFGVAAYYASRKKIRQLLFARA